jgi:nitroimidazol reductase NimA-like FMN-containing flavoprotein (pyridoxamine 5'-phosphate oxidase superfamily)
MIVEELNYEECRQVLAQARLARLACAAENQPYIVPMFLAYHRRLSGEECLYEFTTLDQKVEWMRANPNVCVEVDEIVNRSEWQSVVALGRDEELPNVHEVSQGRPPIRSRVTSMLSRADPSQSAPEPAESLAPTRGAPFGWLQRLFWNWHGNSHTGPKCVQ